MQGFNNFTSYPMSAGQVINSYLQRFANDEFGSNWVARQHGHTAENESVLAWWKEASEMGERAYVEKKTFVPGGKNGGRLSYELLLIARHRYPELLPKFYKMLLKTSRQSWPVAEALAEMPSIPAAEKVKMFLAGIATNHEAHRNAALKFLQGLDTRLADEQILRLLRKAPKTPRGNTG